MENGYRLLQPCHLSPVFFVRTLTLSLLPILSPTLALDLGLISNPRSSYVFCQFFPLCLFSPSLLFFLLHLPFTSYSTSSCLLTSNLSSPLRLSFTTIISSQLLTWLSPLVFALFPSVFLVTSSSLPLSHPSCLVCCSWIINCLVELECHCDTLEQPQKAID